MTNRRPNRRKSKIWKLSKEEFKNIVDSSSTYEEIARKCGYDFEYLGGYYKIVKKRMEEENLSFIELEERRRNHLSNKSQNRARKKKELSEILVEKSSYPTSYLRVRLIKEGLLEEKCDLCGLGNVWNGQSITLQLDHINGIYNDHRIDNLRLLCPNCHSQTDNYTGKNKKTKRFLEGDTEGITEEELKILNKWKNEKKKPVICKNCNGEVSKHAKSGLCRVCSRYNYLNKLEKEADYDFIYQEVAKNGFGKVSEGLNITPNGLKKKLKNLGYDVDIELKTLREFYRYKNNLTGLKYVLLDKKKSIENKYLVSVWYNNKTNYFGSYETREEAAKVADEKMIELFGEDVLTNKKLGLIDY